MVFHLLPILSSSSSNSFWVSCSSSLWNNHMVFSVSYQKGSFSYPKVHSFTLDLGVNFTQPNCLFCLNEIGFVSYWFGFAASLATSLLVKQCTTYSWKLNYVVVFFSTPFFDILVNFESFNQSCCMLRAFLVIAGQSGFPQSLKDSLWRFSAACSSLWMVWRSVLGVFQGQC